ncbi:MAG: (d)CMP kinase [Myxococcales bacterium FL481]|nr:MAG: (d)CMP kinase [Myxococcales bacterium FL481]
MVVPDPRQTPASLVVIDGPAGAGKTTVARRVAARLGYTLLDTGAIYRALALHAERAGVTWEDESQLAELAAALPLRFVPASSDSPQRVLLDGDDVTAAIRTSHISDGASRVSVHGRVRTALLNLQRRLASASVPGCVAEGRDMGTVVFPSARHKFFLTADEPTRAARRHHELVDREGAEAPSLAEVTAEMTRRDQRDTRRAVAPLVRADDAVLVDSSAHDADAVVELIVASIASAARA